MGLVYDYSLKISVRETKNDQYWIVCGNIALSTYLNRSVRVISVSANEH